MLTYVLKIGNCSTVQGIYCQRHDK